MKYAETTTVSQEKSKAEIEATLSRYGATGFLSGWNGTAAFIMFEANARRVKFILPMPDRKSDEFVLIRKGAYARATQAVQDERYAQAIRQRWRALALAIKAKLEVVQSGITSFENEFMSNVVLPNGTTIGEVMKPQIESAYQTRQMPPLLGAGA